MIDTQKIPELRTRGMVPRIRSIRCHPLVSSVFLEVARVLSGYALRLFFSIFLQYSYHTYEDLSRSLVLQTFCYRYTSPPLAELS